jgi:hypothetical protein
MSKIEYQAFPLTSPEVKEQAIRDQYENGYQTGLFCPDEWEAGYKRYGGPGGPWVYSGGRMNDPDRSYNVQSQKENDAWRTGWREGYAEKHRRKADMKKYEETEDLGGHGEGSLR